MDQEATALLARVRAALTLDSLLRPGEAVVIGVSGGVDSLVLLHALAKLGQAVIAVHWDHAMREASAADAAWVEARCGEWGFPFYGGRALQAPVGEAGARADRLAFLEATARELGVQAIALGHHADDQAETVLFRAIRGAGPTGLAGIAPQRPTARGRLVRPLLGLRRGEIETLARAWQLPTLEDPSNRDVAIARNRLRHVALPALTAINAAAIPHMAALARLMREEAASGQEKARRLAKFALHTLAPWAVEVDRACLVSLPLVEARGLLREAWEVVGAPVASAATLERALALARLGGAWDAEGGVRLVATGAWLVLQATGKALPSQPLEVGGVQATRAWGWEISVATGATGAPLDATRVRFQRASLPQNLVWRTACPARDRFQAWGSDRQTRLQTFLTRQGVPAHRQNTLLVLATDEMVAWVVGMRRGSLAPVESGAGEVVEMQATAGFAV